VQKPSSTAQSRIGNGSYSQYCVFKELEKFCVQRKLSFELDGIAPPGSNKPDIEVQIKKRKFQVEVKNAHNRKSYITIFDKSISRNSVIPPDLNYLARMFIVFDRKTHHKINDSTKYSFDFLGILDYIKDNLEPATGLSEDAHTSKSGRMPEFFKTEDHLILEFVRRFIQDNLVESNNHYLAVFNKKDETTKFFHTGLGRNVLRMPELPKLKKFLLSTYGGPNASSTRVGIKVQFDV